MEQLINFIIRPPRAEYSPKHDLLEQAFPHRGKWYMRKDIEIKNCRGEILQCSHYLPITNSEGKSLPCVIYCHGNSGCRADASEAAIILLPSNITVFALDFSGSGLSGGEHVTLGWNEKSDLAAVVEYLRQDGSVSLIGLWGRSMGAVTSLMYGAEDPSIAGMVLDSPFSDLVDLMMELVDTYKIRLPKFTVKFAIQYMRKAIQKKAKFDISELNTIKVAKSCFVPALFGHGIEDEFILPHHSERIYDAYAGDKNIIKFEGDHNSPRPQFYFDSINIFFHNVLHPPEHEDNATYFDTGQNYLGKDDWNSLHPMGTLECPASSEESSASSTINAIEQVRQKRPMSRTEVPSDVANQAPLTEDDEVDETLESRSRMISFELSDGRPFGPHVPRRLDDDQYVEYQLDDLSGFPCDLEEEERMFMEAVILSLKDMDVQAQQPSAATDSKSSISDPAVPSKFATHSNPAKIGEPSNSENPSLMNEKPSQIADSSNSVTLGHETSVVAPQSDAKLETSSKAACNDGSGSSDNASSSDLSGSTKATLTVERNSGNNILDGLAKRWDFNFFRNNR